MEGGDPSQPQEQSVISLPQWRLEEGKEGASGKDFLSFMVFVLLKI